MSSFYVIPAKVQQFVQNPKDNAVRNGFGHTCAHHAP
jgi:hypothetical protein